jgi:hypothetical protein
MSFEKNKYNKPQNTKPKHKTPKPAAVNHLAAVVHYYYLGHERHLPAVGRAI